MDFYPLQIFLGQIISFYRAFLRPCPLSWNHKLTSWYLLMCIKNLSHRYLTPFVFDLMLTPSLSYLKKINSFTYTCLCLLCLYVSNNKKINNLFVCLLCVLSNNKPFFHIHACFWPMCRRPLIPQRRWRFNYEFYRSGNQVYSQGLIFFYMYDFHSEWFAWHSR